ncbi:MAG: hypothetical protein CM15mP83_8650 [Flavobacteriaceae bacterium]|nr:MAG: hypothetical protein CM15mP83_8650 [Flavobacteriaceae bacterium]
MDFWEPIASFPYLGSTYDVLIATFEIFALLVLLLFLFFGQEKHHANSTFLKPEMKGWPKRDAIISFTSNLC